MLISFTFYTPSVYLQHSSCFRSEWETVWILIRWLCEKPADLDLQCFQNKERINLFSRTRVKMSNHSMLKQVFISDFGTFCSAEKRRLKLACIPEQSPYQILVLIVMLSKQDSN